MEFNIPHADRYKSGVYVIRNTIDERVYVGSTTNLKKRFYAHLHALRQGKLNSPQLRELVQKHSVSVLSFDLLTLCSPDELLLIEQQYLDHYQSYSEQLGFNRSPSAGTVKGIILSAETRAKRAFVSSNISAETRAKLSAAMKIRANKPEEKEKFKQRIARVNTTEVRKNRPTSPETRAKMSKSQSIRSSTLEAKAAFVERVTKAKRGKPVSEETKAKMRAAGKARLVDPASRAKQLEQLAEARRHRYAK